MKVIAHRGGALIGNENTLSCIEKGIISGADMIEIDVRMTSDGYVVVCHDATLDRTTNRNGRIENITLKEFKQAKALDHITQEPTDESLPTLEEALLLIKGRAEVLLEIKRERSNQYAGIEEKILSAVHKCGMYNDVVYQSFNDEALLNLYKLDPNIRIEKLLICRLPFGLCFDGTLHKFSFDDYYYCKSFNSMGIFTTEDFVNDCHAAGKEIKIWTVNEPSKLVSNVDGVITNRPDLF